MKKVTVNLSLNDETYEVLNEVAVNKDCSIDEAIESMLNVACYFVACDNDETEGDE